MTTPPDPQLLIAQAREVCEAATPGQIEMMLPLDGDPFIVRITGVDVERNEIAEFVYEGDAELFATARSLVPALAEALEQAACNLDTEEKQCERWRQRCHDWMDRTDKAERELVDHKAKMVDLLADVYAKGRARRHEDDRTSEHD